MILLGSTDVCSIICHVVHDHSVDHIAGVQLGKSDDDDEGLCLALSSSLPLFYKMLIKFGKSVDNDDER